MCGDGVTACLLADPLGTLQDVTRGLKNEINDLRVRLNAVTANQVDTATCYVNIFDRQPGDGGCRGDDDEWGFGFGGCGQPAPTFYRFEQIPSEVALGIYGGFGVN